MKTSFVIKSAGKSDLKTVYVQFYSEQFKHKKLVVASRFSCNINDWDSGQPKKNNKTADLRKGLIDYEEKLNSFITSMMNEQDRVPTGEELREKVYVLNNGEKQEFLDDVFERYMTAKKRELQPSTLRITNKSRELLHEYSSQLTFADITPAFNLKFQQYLLARGTQNVTANNYLRKIKAMLNWAHDQRICKLNVSTNIKLFKEMQKPIFAVENEELIAIENGYNFKTGKPIKLTAGMERIKDLFLFGCYTGIRFEDLQNLTKNNIEAGRIKVMTSKTDEIVKISMLPETKAIWNRYDQQLPQISNVKANVYLKKIFEIHGLDRKVLTIEDKGAIKVKEYLPLYQAITFHKSRKTFIVNAINAGIPTDTIMKLSGHKKYDTFKKYIAISEKSMDTEMTKMSRSARSMSIEKGA